MRKPSLWILMSALLALSLNANAAQRKPGLWEETSTLHFTQGGPQIPPEALAKMKQQGIDPTKLFGAPHTYRQCLTPEQAAQDENPHIGDKDCTMQKAVWSGNSFHGEMACHRSTGETHGVFNGTLTDGENYTGNMRMEGTDPHLGGAFVMEGSFSGKWLGPTCGKDAQ